MKKHILLLAAGALVALSACNNDNTNTGGMTQAQQDSAVNARAADSAAKMKAGNDSMINAAAKMRADSMSHADSVMRAQMAPQQGAKTAKAGTKTVKQTTTTTAPVRHSTPTNVNDRVGGNGTTTNNGKSSTGAPKNVNDRPGGN